MVKLKNMVPDMMEEMLSIVQKKGGEGDFFLLNPSLIK